MRKILTITRLLKLFSLLLFINGCSPRSEPGNMVSVSIQPLEFLVHALSGDAIGVNVMVPPGSSHGTYSPTPQQFQKLSDSRLYLRIGYLGYEQAWIGRLKELSPRMKELNLSNYVELIHGEDIHHGDHVHEGGIDPHIWMSPAVMLELLPVIRDGLLESFPEFSEVILTNYPRLEEKVKELHLAFLELVPTLSHKTFMIFHPALTYLARDYGMNQVSIEYEGKEPSPARLARLIRQARDLSVPVIFIQEEYDLRNAMLISEETGAELFRINPLSYDWIASMDHILQIFEEYLK